MVYKTEVSQFMKKNSRMGSKCLSGWMDGCKSVVCLLINVQGAIFNRLGKNLNPICISELSRDPFVRF